MKHPLRRRWMFFAFLGFRAVARWLPLPVAQALGGCLGLIAYGLLGRYRALTYAHLRLAFGPSLSDSTCHHVARRVFANLGKTAVEWCVLARLSPARIRRVVEVRGLIHLHQALAKGRGVIAVSGHFGNWELLSIALTSLGFEGGVLARPLRYPEYEGFLQAMRLGKGVATYHRGAVKEVSRLLRANQIIGVVPDQDVDSLEGVFVDFFEHPAYTPVGPAALALMTGAPLIPCFCVRDGRRFRIVIEEPIPITRTEDRPRDLVAITQAWSQIVESYIRRHPDQWAWMHRRWKTQPATTEDRGQRTEDRPIVASKRRELELALSCLLSSVFCLLFSVFLGCAKPMAPKAQGSSEPPGGTQPGSNEAVTQQMDRFTMSGYAADGAKRWELVGTGASVEGAFVTIRQPNAVGYELPDASGALPAQNVEGQAGAQTGPQRTAYLTASLAQVQQTGHRVRLEHEVTIHTSDGLWLTSPTMYWLPDRDEMMTEQAVRLETDHMLLRGREATGHTQLKHAVIQRDVELVLNPSTTQDTTAGEPSHVQITCDGPLSFDYEQNIAIFERNVHVVDPQGDLYSDKLIAYLDGATRTITYAEALGNVRMVQGANTATSERAVYEPARGKVTLLGSPSLLVYPDDQQSPGLAASFGGLASPPAGAAGQGQGGTAQAGSVGGAPASVSTSEDPSKLFRDVAQGQ